MRKGSTETSTNNSKTDLHSHEELNKKRRKREPWTDNIENYHRNRKEKNKKKWISLFQSDDRSSLHFYTSIEFDVAALFWFFSSHWFSSSWSQQSYWVSSSNPKQHRHQRVSSDLWSSDDVLVIPVDTNEVVLRWNKTGITIAGGFGPGNGSHQLNTPRDLALYEQNTLYIADTLNNRIQKFLRDAANGSTVAGTGVNGTSSNQLSSPSGVLSEVNGNIHIADLGNHRILRWQNGASAGSTIAGIGQRILEIDKSNHSK